ncbi:MAG TPA: FGGY family carbohydrate kinase [Armatimonadota bacterium]|nr:FGGY family carbohydrate kinase [Armatimonadota bacterium]
MGALIGIDIGTTKICILAIEETSCEVVACATHASGSVSCPENGAVEQNVIEIRNTTFRLLRDIASELAAKDFSVSSIGVTGQMHGVLLVDQHGDPVTDLLNWQDKRGNDIFANTGRTYADEVALRLGDERLYRSGTKPATGYGAVTLFRLAANSAIPQGVKALTIHDYLVSLLCGKAITDPTDAASWGILDVTTCTDWLTDCAEVLNIPTPLLPQIQPTGTIAGNLLPEIASAIGLPEGIPVAVALGDNQASYIGSVPALHESILLNLGTGGQMSVATGVFSRPDELEIRPLVNGTWLLVGASLCGGRAFKILADFFATVGRDIFGLTDIPLLYPTMTRLASTISDAGDVSFLPLFAGKRSAPMATAQVSGLCEDNFTAAHLTRSLIAGMVDELLDYYQIAVASGAAPTVAAGSGNAFRQNDVIYQEMQRKLGLPFYLPPLHEEAAVGAALVGGVAAGVYTNWQEASRSLYQRQAIMP